MVWYQLNITNIAKDQLEAAAEQLEELGAVSITFTDQEDSPIYEPELNTTPLWQNTVLTALYQDEPLLTISHQWLAANFPQAIIRKEIVEDKVWEREWLKSFKPMSFGERLWICPSHCSPPEPNAVNVMLDPGLAFGTGTHPTTSLCLSFLDGAQLQDKTVCDYGTGSGILAISAIKLGAKVAHAVDIDPQAVIATKQNAKANHIPDQQLTVGLVGDIELQAFDVVVANILAGPLIELAPTLISHVKPGGKLVISGLLVEQLEEITEAYQPLVKTLSTQSLDEWAMCVMEV